MKERGTTETINLSAFEYFTPRRVSEAQSMILPKFIDLLGKNTCPGTLSDRRKGTEVPKLALVLSLGPNTQRGNNIVRCRDCRGASNRVCKTPNPGPIQKTGIFVFILGAQSILD